MARPRSPALLLPFVALLGCGMCSKPELEGSSRKLASIPLADGTLEIHARVQGEHFGGELYVNGRQQSAFSKHRTTWDIHPRVELRGPEGEARELYGPTLPSTFFNDLEPEITEARLARLELPHCRDEGRVVFRVHDPQAGPGTRWWVVYTREELALLDVVNPDPRSDGIQRFPPYPYCERALAATPSLDELLDLRVTQNHRASVCSELVLAGREQEGAACVAETGNALDEAARRRLREAGLPIPEASPADPETSAG